MRKDIRWPSWAVGTVGRIACLLSHRTGGRKDIRWPLSPGGAVGCTALVLSHKTGGRKDIRWPSLLIGMVRCTGDGGSRGEEADEGKQEAEEER